MTSDLFFQKKNLLNILLSQNIKFKILGPINKMFNTIIQHLTFTKYFKLLILFVLSKKSVLQFVNFCILKVKCYYFEMITIKIMTKIYIYIYIDKVYQKDNGF